MYQLPRLSYLPMQAATAPALQQAWLAPGLPPRHQAVLARHQVHVVGAGKPPLLFCNGFGCTQHIWNHLRAALAEHYQLVFFDQIGVGDTNSADYDPHRYGTLRGYAQDVQDICRALDLRDVVLVGHSAGATIAMLAATADPDCFAKVIMLAASPYYLNEPGYYGGFERRDLLEVLAAMQAHYPDWANTFATMLLGQELAPSLGFELAENFCRAHLGIAREFARLCFLADCRAAVPHLRQPTLLLQCTDDIAVPAEVGEYLLAHLPQATLVTLATTGHCPHLSAPMEVVAEILAFLG